MSFVLGEVGDDLRWLCSLLGFSHSRLTPYCLRRGGATHLFSSTFSFDRVTVIGRWSQVRTARIYVNEALALLSSIRETPQHSRLLRGFAERLRAFLLSL